MLVLWLKPRKFQVRQENMMASMRKRGMLSNSPVHGFPRTTAREVDTVPRFLHLITALFGTGRQT